MGWFSSSLQTFFHGGRWFTAEAEALAKGESIHGFEARGVQMEDFDAAKLQVLVMFDVVEL